MQPDQQGLTKTYSGLPDVEIASLYAQIDTLSDVARTVLSAEIERRHLSSEQLSRLFSSQLRQEANFDRREKIRRKGVASYLLFRNDPKGTLAAFIVILLLGLLALIAGRH